MRKIKKICVVTGSRADYGLLYWIMKEIQENSAMKLIPVATGSHLSPKSNYSVNEIIRDGFKNVKKIKISCEDTSPEGITKAMGEGIIKFADFFKKNKIDLLFLLGDRFEILSAALAALPFNSLIAHSGGGEITEGTIDNYIRSCLTKLSHLHFAISKKSAERIKKMGEEPWRIKITGSPRLDFVNRVRYKSKKELQAELDINFSKKVAVVIYHPVTMEFRDAGRQIGILLSTVQNIDIESVILYPNIDTHSDIIIKKIKKFAKKNKNAKLLKQLSRTNYLNLLNSADIMIGNSSSGLIEGPSFRLPVVDVGNRQKGRECAPNIIHTDYSYNNIKRAIEKGLHDKSFKNSLKNMKNPFGDGRASKKIVKILSNIDLDKFSIIKKLK